MQNKKKATAEIQPQKPENSDSFFSFFSILSYKQAKMHETKFFFMYIYFSRAWKVVFSQKCIHKSKYVLNYGFRL